MKSLDETLIIIQARINSKRLPGKTIKKLNSSTLLEVVLSRAKQSGIKTFIATSEEVQDDIIEKISKKHNVFCFRGDEADVRSRYIKILKPLHKIKNVIRLTADNPLPDKYFIIDALNVFLKAKRVGAKFLTTNWEKNFLPYGLSIEIFDRNFFLKNCKLSDSKFDKEHVTPKLKRITKNNEFEFSKIDPRFLNFKISVDTIKDYKKVHQMFKNVVDIENEPWWQIIKFFPSYEKYINKKYRNPEIILGGAQIGMKYGISNDQKFLPKNGKKIIIHGIKQGILEIDTAPNYGKSEKNIGEIINQLYEKNIKVNTKLNLKKCDYYLDDLKLFNIDINSSITNSFNELGIDNIKLG